ncbi:MAG TPA: MFS transporter [Gaiellaceae bacterium]|nr:MFS transporter [Gaiellaceae bacterium]
MRRGLGGAPLGLLQEASGFRRLFVATLASSVGTYLAVVALTIHVYDESGGDANWVGALLIADFLPVIVIGLVFGPLLDRLPRRRILVASDLARAAVFCVLPFAESPGQIVALALLAGVATSFFRPAVFAGLPNLVPDERLPTANGLLQSAENFTWAVGAVAGGAVVNLGGTDVAYWVNAGTFLVSALLVLGIRRSLEESGAEGGTAAGYLSQLREGLGVVGASRALLTVVVAWSVATVAQAIGNVSEIFLARDVFGAGSLGFGVLVAAAALGLFVGSLSGGALIDRFGIRGPYLSSILLMAVGFGVAAAAPEFWLAVAIVVVSGFGNGAAVVCNAVLVQRAVPDRIRGRAFTLVMSIGYACFGLGMIVAGPLTNALGARTAWGISGALCVLAAVVAAALLAPSEALREQRAQGT